MHALVTPDSTVFEPIRPRPAPALASLSTLRPGTTAIVRRVGTGEATALERRLIELGFVNGERLEVVTQVRPGGDPFVVRVGDTTLALRRREVETVWVETAPPTPSP